MKCLPIALVLVLACLCAMFEETIGSHHVRPHRDEKRRWKDARGKQGGRWKGRGREAFGHGRPHPRRHRGPQSEEHRSPWWRGEGDYEDPGMWKKEPARGRHDSLWKRWRHSGPRQFEIGIGHSPEDSWFNFDIDFSQWFGVDRQWWKGPNVCTRRTEAEKNDTGEIQRHTSVHSKVCDETDSVYKCVTVLDIFGSRREFTEIKECCHGFARNAGEKGCTKRLDLKDLVATVEAMNLTEFLRSVDSVGLRPELKQGNFTVFAPVNQAFDGEPNITPELPRPPSPRDQGYQDVPMSNLVLVSRPLTDMLVNDMKQLILGHVVVDALKTSEMSDEQTLETGSPIKSTIRINFFEYPHKLVTANCARILKADVQATNGVIHTVERVLSPVTTSLIGLVSKNEELSILKTLLSKASLVQMLKKTDGHFTLFAPTNSAFEKLPKEMRKKLFMGDACLKSILLQHILPRVICSAVIDKRVRTANMLDRYIALTRDTNDKIFAEGVQVTGTDLMATNGVLHLVDEVIIPDDALSVLEVAQKNGAGRVVELIQRAGLADKLNGLNNITIFAPSDKAFTELDDRITDALEMDGDYMQRVLTFHVTDEKYSASQLVNNKQLKTLHTAQKLSVNEYYNFPFGRQRMKTVECAAIVKPDLRACNGLVHVIDQVMRPPTGTVLDAIRMYPEFKTFLNLVEKVELSNMLQGEGPITVLVPTNLALEDIGEIEDNEDQLKEIIKNHIITDTVCCSGIFGGRWFLRQKIRTFSGETFSMDRGRGDTPMIDRAQIMACDIMGTNGVIQKIDRVLVKRHQVERRRHFRERGHWDRERGHWDRERGGWGDKFQSWLDDLEFR